MMIYPHAARRFLAFLAFLMPLSAFALEPSHGVHGMALFGDRDGLYASHLPLFHAPHDNQVVIKVRFKDPRREREMRARLHGKTALWTIEPERFALHRLAPGAAAPLRAFKANVFEGHFERNGAMRMRQAGLLVERVVLYRTLSAQPAQQSVSRYQPVGRFLVKVIDSRPDFDHIVLLRRALAAPVEVPKHGVDENLASLARLAPYAGTVYYETADLR
jgi:hypothetical protein